MKEFSEIVFHLSVFKTKKLKQLKVVLLFNFAFLLLKTENTETWTVFINGKPVINGTYLPYFYW